MYIKVIFDQPETDGERHTVWSTGHIRSWEDISISAIQAARQRGPDPANYSPCNLGF